MWTFCSVLVAAYAALFLCKLYWHEGCERVYEKFGLDIGLFQIKISSSARGRWVTNIPTIRRCKSWYKVGTVVSVLLVLPSVCFLVVNLFKLIQILFATPEEISSSPVKVRREDLIFQPVIPGVTFPMSEAGIYGFSLFVCTIFHELGHALAADCHDVKLLGYGVMIFFVVPAAFVDMSTSELTSLSKREQLKIYTAGVWHNLVLAVVAFLLMLCLPTILSPCYLHQAGVTVVDVSPNTSVADGLKSGDVVLSVNDCKVFKIADFYSCLRQEAKAQKGYCVSLDTIDQLQCSDCCKNNASFLGFKGVINSEVCMPVRDTLNMSSAFCLSSACQDHEDCLTPDLAFPRETLWHFRRMKQKDFLFIGSLTDLHKGVDSVTEYVIKNEKWPLSLPLTIEKSLYYITSFSLALALINIIPCAMLDGQYVVQALLGMCPYSSWRIDCLTKFFVHSGSLLLIANLGLTFFAMKS